MTVLIEALSEEPGLGASAHASLGGVLANTYLDQHPLQDSSKKTFAERLRYARSAWGEADI